MDVTKQRASVSGFLLNLIQMPVAIMDEKRVDYLFNGAPTATEQSWPGCPCGGFIPDAATALDASNGGGVNDCGTFSLG
ncbi:hypothetical protein ACSX1A_18745 [Pontibacter sp. MBLB2868]|uniref:hypothetical protein n=1 Tax=Pontibacter sp. MBLB2868 TaxID=3451555 RepID=UPI003F74DA57